MFAEHLDNNGSGDLPARVCCFPCEHFHIMNVAALEHCGWRPLVGFAVERLKVINAEHHMSEFSINWTLGEILTNVHFTWYVLQCLAAVDTREKPSHGICWGSKMCCTVPYLRERDDGHQNVTTYTLQTQ